MTNDCCYLRCQPNWISSILYNLDMAWRIIKFTTCFRNWRICGTHHGWCSTWWSTWLEDMIRDVRVKSFAEAHEYGSMSSDAETPLYPGSTNFTQLSTVLRLMNLKVINWWNDKSFTKLLHPPPLPRHSSSSLASETKAELTSKIRQELMEEMRKGT